MLRRVSADLGAVGELYDLVMFVKLPWVYFDGNAITAMWDWYTKVHPVGATGEPRSASPFEHAVLSDYSLDEIATQPISNAYKQHLLFLAIFPDIPVLQSLEIIDITAARADRTRLLRPTEYLQQAIGGRLLALAGHEESLAALAHDVNRKHDRARADIVTATTNERVPKESRLRFADAVAMAIETNDLDPSHSARDFFLLCKILYSYEVIRLIDRPSGERKGPSRQLNQQIDHYHLSYLPFVDGFVTDDRVLLEMATCLASTFRFSVEIDNVSSFHERWMRRKLLE